MKIFITGNSRSGTTMMSRILGNHKDVFTFQELHFFDELLPSVKADEIPSIESSTNIFSTLCAIQRNGYFGSRDIGSFREEAAKVVKEIPGASYLSLFEKFLLTETKKNKKTIPCEQTPQNIFFLDDLLHNNADSKVIVMIRDPREVLLSQKYKWKRRQLSGGKIPFRETIRARINYHPVTISRIWKSVMQTALKYQNNPSVIFIKYEDLVQHPDKTIRSVCAHCGIAFSESMFDIPVAGSSNFGDSGQKRGVDSTKLHQWKTGGLNATEIAYCQKTNGTLMRQFGYDTTYIHSSLLLLIWYKISLPFQLGLALLFNLKRLKNVNKIVKRFIS